MVTVDFYFGLVSRYSYLASTQPERIERETGCKFNWKPLASGTLTRRRGVSPFDGSPISGQYEWPYREYDAKCWAAHYGVPFHEPDDRHDPSSKAHACLAADEQGLLERYAQRLFRAIFEGSKVVDDTLLVELARELGLDADLFTARMSSPDIEQCHDALVDEAAARGAFGVPTFFVGEQMFWGNDRLTLLEAFLKGTSMPAYPLGDS